MRPGWVLGGLTLFAALGSSVRAEYEAVVVVPQVEVRSGPSPAFYPTSRLRSGDRVTLISDAPQNRDYLAIKPPADSFSWIKRNAIGITSGQKAIVQQDDTPIRVGSRLDGRPPIVEWFKLAKGTPVTLINLPGASDEQGAWVPIYPAAKEVRYIPMSAVKKADTATAAAPPLNQGFAPMPSGTPATTTANSWSSAIATAPTQSQQPSAAPPSQVQLMPGNPPVYSQGSYCPPQTSWACQPRTWNGAPAPARPTSQYTYAADGQVRVAQAPPPAYQAPMQPAPASYRPPAAQPAPPVYQAAAPAATEQMVGPGWLRKAGRTLEERPTYVLETTQGYPLIYVHAAAGLNLDNFIGKRVNLAGPVYYRGDLRTWYITVNSVTTPR